MPTRRLTILLASAWVALFLLPSAVRAADAAILVIGARPPVGFSPPERAIFRVCGTIGAATLAVMFAGIAITAWRAGAVHLGKHRRAVSVRQATDPLPFYLAITVLW